MAAGHRQDHPRTKRRRGRCSSLGHRLRYPGSNRKMSHRPWFSLLRMLRGWSPVRPTMSPPATVPAIQHDCAVGPRGLKLSTLSAWPRPRSMYAADAHSPAGRCGATARRRSLNAGYYFVAAGFTHSHTHFDATMCREGSFAATESRAQCGFLQPYARPAWRLRSRAAPGWRGLTPRLRGCR
jgi:hypothetical protein